MGARVVSRTFKALPWQSSQKGRPDNREPGWLKWRAAVPAREQAVGPNIAVLRRNEVCGQEKNRVWKGYAENLLAVVLLKLHLAKGLSGELLGKSPFIHTATVPEMSQRKS